MKKVILILLMIFPTLAWGQQFYQQENVSTSYGYGQSSFSSVVDATIANGGARPTLSYNSDGSICATTFINNCFLVLKFVNNSEIYICGANGSCQKLFDQYDDYKMGFYMQPGFTGVLDFSKFVYNESAHDLFIPFTKGNTGYYMLHVKIESDPAGIESIYTSDSFTGDNSPQYYNLQGLPVDENAKGQVIIKKEGTKSTKYINR